MKVVILAAGFGTRLEKDLQKESQFNHLKGVPKPLLPIGKQTLVDRWLKILMEAKVKQSDVWIVTNGNNRGRFMEWSKSWPEIHLCCDGAISNETRTGAVGCMSLAVDHCTPQYSDDVLFIAGDTLFYDDFDLHEMLEKFVEFQRVEETASMVLYVNCPDELVHKYGILETDAGGRVVNFKEKPQPSETMSRKQCPCFYFINKESLPLLKTFLRDSKLENIKAWDATGNFITYLIHRKPVYAVEISGRFDVGGLDSYIECHKHFLSKYHIPSNNT